MLHYAQLCSIMLHKFIKLLLFELIKPISLTTFSKELRVLSFRAICQFAYNYMNVLLEYIDLLQWSFEVLFDGFVFTKKLANLLE